MKLFVNAMLFAAFAVGSASSAEACCLWPFGGWYGAGYGAAPAYGYSGAGYSGYYSAGYPAYAAPSYGVGYYSAGYATSSNCCAPSCCNSCDGGSCGSSSCVGSTSSGSLKPTTDPNFDRSSPKSKDYDRDGVKSRSTIDDESDPIIRGRNRETNPVDDFGRTPAGGTGTGSGGTGTGGMFEEGEDGIQNSKKPPMTDPAEGAPADSTDPKKDGTTFLEGESTTSNSYSRKTRRDDSLAERSSGLSEVIAPKRLASRSLPSNSTRSKTSFAGKSNDNKRGADAPIRWISIPAPEGQARL